jgi:hypothetical protein
MAFDLVFGKNNRDFSRGSSSSVVGADSGEDRVIVVKEDRSMGLFGWTVTICLGSRIITGKWPWYWFGQAARRLEGPTS